MSQDPEPLVLWKYEPKPKNPKFFENMSQDPEPLVLKNTWLESPYFLDLK